MSNLCSFIFLNYDTSIVITSKNVSKRPRTFITVITQIKTFILNLDTSNKKLEATKCSLERFFQKE